MNHRGTETQRIDTDLQVTECLFDPLYGSARFFNAKNAKVIHRKALKAHLNLMVGASYREVFARGDALNPDACAAAGSSPRS